MRGGDVEYESLCYFGWGAKEGDGSVRGGLCGVFVRFGDCHDGAVFPDVGYGVV